MKRIQKFSPSGPEQLRRKTARSGVIRPATMSVLMHALIVIAIAMASRALIVVSCQRLGRRAFAAMIERSRGLQ
ncbi:MAG TPA: hypothetical protein VJQ52_23665, partial [Steroidobacteraceae bacterium]|nr:hypothetical protein [Steroidobacteraceae bacterium]